MAEKNRIQQSNDNDVETDGGGYMFLNQTPSQFLERRLATTFGINSMSIKALDLVREEMCVEKGFARDDGQDYYNHCVDVANTLLSFCVMDEDAICAALLHDIVEDVEGYTEQTISRLFNPRVAHFKKKLLKHVIVSQLKQRHTICLSSRNVGVNIHVMKIFFILHVRKFIP